MFGRFAIILTAASCCLAAAAPAAETAPPAPAATSVLSPFAGEFDLRAADGSSVRSVDLAGRPYGIFFGFLSCPDICPTTLADLSLALSRLPPPAADLRIYFVSVDPADSLEAMQRYVSSFDPRIVPLGGDRRAVEHAIRSFGIVVKETRQPDGTSTFGHTAAVLLVDGDGLLAGRTSFQDTEAEMAAKLRALIEP